MPNDSFVDYSVRLIADRQTDRFLIRHQRSAHYPRHDSICLGVILYEMMVGNQLEIQTTVPTELSAWPEAIPPKNARPVHTKISRLSHWLYFSAALIVLLMSLTGCQQIRESLNMSKATSSPLIVTPTIHPLFQVQTPAQDVTPTAKTTATPEQGQTLSTTMPQILLLNPAPGSEFVNTEAISFEWSYPVPLTSNQQFLLRITNGTGTQILGSVSRPISDLNYAFTVDLSEIESISGNQQWFVVLETQSGGEEILRSKPQQFIVKADTLLTTPEITRTLTLTPENQTINLTQTPLLVCTPAPPSGWVVYTVQDGDFLFNLALATGSSVERLQEINCLSEPGLGVGQQLWLPVLPPTATPIPAPTSNPAPSSSNNDSGPSNPTKTPPPAPN